MISSDFPLDRPRGSKNPTGAVIPTTVSSFHALREVDVDTVLETGAKADAEATREPATRDASFILISREEIRRENKYYRGRIARRRVVADVDCTTDGGKAVCDGKGVRGYPTIKYFKDGDKEGKDYSGARDYDGLLKFVKEELERPCTIEDQQECSDKEKEFIKKMQGKGAEEIKKQLDRLEGMKGKSMKADLKQWWGQRLNILTQLAK